MKRAQLLNTVAQVPSIWAKGVCWIIVSALSDLTFQPLLDGGRRSLRIIIIIIIIQSRDSLMVVILFYCNLIFSDSFSVLCLVYVFAITYLRLLNSKIFFVDFLFLLGDKIFITISLIVQGTKSTTTTTLSKRLCPEGSACTRSARTRAFQCTTSSGAGRVTRPIATQSASTASRPVTAVTLSSSSDTTGGCFLIVFKSISDLYTSLVMLEI